MHLKATQYRNHITFHSNQTMNQLLSCLLHMCYTRFPSICKMDRTKSFLFIRSCTTIVLLYGGLNVLFQKKKKKKHHMIEKFFQKVMTDRQNRQLPRGSCLYDIIIWFVASYLTNQLNISAVQLVSGFLRIMNHWKVNNDPKQHIFCPIFSEKVESAMDKLMDKTRIFLFLFFCCLGGLLNISWFCWVNLNFGSSVAVSLHATLLGWPQTKLTNSSVLWAKQMLVYSH